MKFLLTLSPVTGNTADEKTTDCRVHSTQASEEGEQENLAGCLLVFLPILH